MTDTTDQSDWGRTVETTVRERWGFELVSDDPEAPWWFDARATADTSYDVGYTSFGTIAAGTPIEVKAARYRITDGRTTRRGRWWIRESSHDRLVENDGEYALAVYDTDPERENAVLALSLRPAWWVDQLVTWSTWRPRHQADRAARVPWSQVFESDDIADNAIRSGRAES